MIDIRTGKKMTRGGFLRGGIASIIAAKSAPYVALGATSLAGSANASVGRGMMRNVGARNAAMFGGGKPTAKDYVQDGLIAMWDGIENDGWGRHTNSSYSWKDLSEVTGDLTALNSELMYFGDDNITLNGLNNFPSLKRELYSFSSLEVVFYADPAYLLSSPGLIICPGGTRTDVTFKLIDVRPGGDKIQIGGRTFGGKVKELYIKKDLNNSISVVYDGDLLDSSIESVKINGEYGSTIRELYNGWDPNNWFCIGGRQGGTYSFHGKIYCVRLYSKKLSDTDAMNNYFVDKARFGIA